ncbi:Kae1-like domain-containing protein, partial [Methylogaea oryzae]
ARLAALPTVVLCGGCFQNRLLLELCVERLRHAGFDVYWPQRIPPNDGGLALGQLWAARRQAPA